MRQISFQAGQQNLECELESDDVLQIGRIEEAGALRASLRRDGAQFVGGGLKTLSQEHARLKLQTDGRVMVADCGSTNGTYLRIPASQAIELPENGELLLGRELTVRLRPSSWAASVKDMEPPRGRAEDLVAFLRARLHEQVETIRLVGAGDSPAAEKQGSGVARLPILESAQQLVVQWRSGTYDVEADGWLRNMVSLYNSQQTPAGESNWQFTAVSSSRLQALWLARRVAPADCTVLLRGSTGSGKDVLANDIHNHSGRARGPFIAVNCSAIPEPLFESELFGHVKGAFTNATEARPGLFELADGGTLFLDEIGEIPLPLQAKLLRVIEDHKVRGVGARRERRLDVRVLAATNRPLEKMVEQGAFREDLFYRLNTVQIFIPPLERGDLRELTRTFLDGLGATRGAVLSDSEKVALADLAAAEAFRGGARELRNALDRYLLLRVSTRSTAENWRATIGAAGKLPAAHPPERTATPSGEAGTMVQKPPLAAARLIDNLLFLTVAKDALEQEARAGISEIAARVGLTYQGVANRLRNLDIKLDGKNDVARLTARITEEQAGLAAYGPWLRSLLP